MEPESDDARMREVLARAAAVIEAAKLTCQNASAVVARIDAQTREQRERIIKLMAPRDGSH
jgi:hypothetical protein